MQAPVVQQRLLLLRWLQILESGFACRLQLHGDEALLHALEMYRRDLRGRPQVFTASMRQRLAKNRRRL